LSLTQVLNYHAIRVDAKQVDGIHQFTSKELLQVRKAQSRFDLKYGL